MTRSYTRNLMIAAATLCLVAVSAPAEETAPAPADEAAPAQQLPEGHPPLPQGHPDISQMQKPQQPRKFHGGELPPGHPSVNAEPEEPVVYETTDVEPDWHVAMRHIIVRPMADQLHITEVWALSNPTEKSYVGLPAELFEDPMIDPAATDSATPATPEQPTLERVVLTLPLPDHASHVQTGSGFAPGQAVVKDGQIVSGTPLTPGTTQYRVGYLLASQDGVFTLPLASPKLTDHAMVFLPDDGAEITAEGLTAGDSFKAGDKIFRVYMGSKLEKDADVSLTIKAQPPTEGTAAVPGASGASGMPGASGMTPSAGEKDPLKMIAGFGGAVLLIAAVIMLFKPAKKQPAASAVL